MDPDSRELTTNHVRRPVYRSIIDHHDFDGAYLRDSRGQRNPQFVLAVFGHDDYGGYAPGRHSSGYCPCSKRTSESDFRRASSINLTPVFLMSPRSCWSP